jgi:hypothetical protein
LSFEVHEILNIDFTLLTSIHQFELYFDGIADKLLNQCVVEINHRFHRISNTFFFSDSEFVCRAHRFEEIEFYCHSGIHQDPFAHCNPIQQSFGKWYAFVSFNCLALHFNSWNFFFRYFHRNGNNYRGGSYKGVDLTFGAENVCTIQIINHKLSTTSLIRLFRKDLVVF